MLIRQAERNQCEWNGEDAFPKKAEKDSQGRIKIVQGGAGAGSTIGYNPDYLPKYRDGKICHPPAIVLGHELIHALHNAEGENLINHKDYTDPETLKPSNHEEARTIGRGAYEDEFLSENALRKEFRDKLGYTEEKGYRIRKRTSHANSCPGSYPYVDIPSPTTMIA